MITQQLSVTNCKLVALSQNRVYYPRRDFPALKFIVDPAMKFNIKQLNKKYDRLYPINMKRSADDLSMCNKTSGSVHGILYSTAPKYNIFVLKSSPVLNFRSRYKSLFYESLFIPSDNIYKKTCVFASSTCYENSNGQQNMSLSCQTITLQFDESE